MCAAQAPNREPCIRCHRRTLCKTYIGLCIHGMAWHTIRITWSVCASACVRNVSIGQRGDISGATGTDFDLISRHISVCSTCLSLCMCVHCNVHATIRLRLLLLRCNLLSYDHDVALVLCIQSKLVVLVSSPTSLSVYGCRKCFASNPF